MEQGSMRQLSSDTVRLLTSAQVVTSVYSAVKELAENSLDAGATSISVKLDNCGLDRIEVKDNGSGIQPQDAAYMARPHCTSKISDETDLSTLQTYGFRGEALASLCAVSDVVIATRTSAQEHGTLYTLDNEGLIKESKPAPMSVGTVVTAEQLFKSVPVRRQAIKSSQRRHEAVRQVEQLLLAFSLVCTSVRFVLVVDRKLVWQRAPGGDLNSALRGVWGSEVMKHMYHMHETNTESQVKVEAYVPELSCPPELSCRSNKDKCFCFVNDRPVTLKEIDKVLKKCFATAVKADASRIPLSFVHISLPPSQLDVNLEPNKTRVLLHDMDEISGWFDSLLAELYQPKTDCPPVLNSNPCDDIITNNNTDSVEQDRQQNNELNAVDEKDSSVNIDKCTVVTLNGDDFSLETSNELNAVDEKDTSVNIDKCTVVTLNGDDFSLEMSNELNAVDEKDTSVNIDKCTVVTLNGDDFSLEMSNELNAVDENDTSVNIDKCTVVTLNGDDFSLEMTSADVLPEINADSQCGIIKDSSVMTSTPANNHQKTNSSSNPHKNHSENSNSVDSIVKPSLVKPQEICTGASGWSKGHSIHNAQGHSIQPVKLIVPNSTVTSNSTSLPRAHGAVHSLTDVSTSSVSIPSLVNTQPASSSCLSVSSPSNILTVSDPKVSSQSTSLQKSFISPARVNWNSPIMQQAKRASPALPSSKRSSSSNATNKRKLDVKSPTAANTSVLEMLTTAAKKPRLCGKAVARSKQSKSVSFSLASARDYWRASTVNRCPVWESYLLDMTSLSPIGPFKSHGTWACLHKKNICMFSPQKAQERIIYHQLIQNHILPAVMLENPLILTQSLFGQSWTTLLGLSKTKESFHDLQQFVTDPRITSNGFKICVKEFSPDQSLQYSVIAMASVVDVKCLQQILSNIKLNAQLTVSESRPQSVLQFFKSESVRMAHRQQVHHSRDDISNIWQQTRDTLTHSCLHEHKILYDVYDLSQVITAITQSQMTQSDTI